MALGKSLGGSGGGGGAITVKNAGSTLTAALTEINVTAGAGAPSNVGGVVTLPVPRSSYTAYDQDKPPASAHASDEEGVGTPGATVSGLTSTNAGTSTLTYDTIGQRMKLLVPSGNGDQVRFYFKTAPVGNYTITTRIRARMVSGFGTATLAVRDSSTGRLLIAGIQCRNPAIHSVYQKWNTVTSFSSESNPEQLFPNGKWHPPMFVQMTWNGTNTTIRYQFEGDDEWWTMLSADTFVATPNQIGIAVNTHSAVDTIGWYEFWRVKAATSDTIGGTRDIVVV